MLSVSQDGSVGDATPTVTELPSDTDPPPVKPVPAVIFSAPVPGSCPRDAVPPISENCAAAPPVTWPATLYVSFVAVPAVTTGAMVVAMPTLVTAPVRLPVIDAALPVTFVGCAQFADPFAVTPCAKFTPLH